MGTIIIGDLHGKIDIVKEVLEWDNPIVFIGDYLDSFTDSVQQQIDLLDIILDAVEKRPDTTALIGNHELSYLDERYMASGWTGATQIHVDDRKERMLELLVHFAIVEDFLVTHAGVSNAWLDRDINTLEEMENYLLFAPDTQFYQIGRGRGGLANCGGPLWCDYWDEFKPVDGIKQIFGHSAWRPKGQPPGIVTDEIGNWNIDCLDREAQILEVSKEGANILTL